MSYLVLRDFSNGIRNAGITSMEYFDTLEEIEPVYFGKFGFREFKSNEAAEAFEKFVKGKGFKTESKFHEDDSITTVEMLVGEMKCWILEGKQKVKPATTMYFIKGKWKALGSQNWKKLGHLRNEILSQFHEKTLW